MQLQSQQPTILAVDDCTFIQEVIKEVLVKDYNVLVASNATDALSIIYRQPVAILLLDVSMPGVDGLELCRTLRSLPQFSKLPIIMLTGRDTVFDKVQGRLAGATEYLTKPIEIEQLQEVCRKFLATSTTNTRDC
ncbi:MAG TPA: response regulator [Candidatus Sericytochromatia bacterium]|jgi:twitching motility two-component system response regulator PilG|nr:response regulator [Tolypothrix sp. T3-bin4]